MIKIYSDGNNEYILIKLYTNIIFIGGGRELNFNLTITETFVKDKHRPTSFHYVYLPISMWADMKPHTNRSLTLYWILYH